MQESHNKIDNRQHLKDEVSFLSRIGIHTSKEEINRINEESKLQSCLLLVLSPKHKKVNSLQLNELEFNKKLLAYKRQQENFRKENDYLCKLNEWEKEHLNDQRYNESDV